MRYDKEKTAMCIQQLSALIDPVALMGWIAKKTKYGDKPGPSDWHYTEVFLSDYGIAGELDKVTAAFGLVGVSDEVDAGVWLAENVDQVP